MSSSRPAWSTRDARRGPPVPGRQALVLAALAIGLVMLGIQLWLLTVALEMYLGGEGDNIWTLAIASGVVFVGGLFGVWLLSRRPEIPGGAGDHTGP